MHALPQPEGSAGSPGQSRRPRHDVTVPGAVPVQPSTASGRCESHGSHIGHVQVTGTLPVHQRIAASHGESRPDTVTGRHGFSQQSRQREYVGHRDGRGRALLSEPWCASAATVTVALLHCGSAFSGQIRAGLTESSSLGSRHHYGSIKESEFPLSFRSWALVWSIPISSPCTGVARSGRNAATRARQSDGRDKSARPGQGPPCQWLRHSYVLAC